MVEKYGGLVIFHSIIQVVNIIILLIVGFRLFMSEEKMSIDERHFFGIAVTILVLIESCMLVGYYMN